MAEREGASALNLTPAKSSLVFVLISLWLLINGARTFCQYRRTYAAQDSNVGANFI